jgi:hypothetical protein
VNPLLYAILSKNFRKGMSELLICSFKPNPNKASNKRAVTHVSKKSSIFSKHSIDNIDKPHEMTEHVIEFDSTCNDFAPSQ